MAGAGYTPDEIDAMPAQDAFALLRYWRDHPQSHEILAAVHLVTRVARVSRDDPSGIGTLIARFPDGIVTSQGR